MTPFLKSLLLDAQPRVEREIWRDRQGIERFRFDGITWAIGIDELPDDVRRAYLERQMEIERTTKQ